MFACPAGDKFQAERPGNALRVGPGKRKTFKSLGAIYGIGISYF